MCLEGVDQIKLCFSNLVSLRPVYIKRVGLKKMVLKLQHNVPFLSNGLSE